MPLFFVQSHSCAPLLLLPYHVGAARVSHLTSLVGKLEMEALTFGYSSPHGMKVLFFPHRLTRLHRLPLPNPVGEHFKP